ncbi:protein HEATR9-like isoform X2 [Heptranchias perlo]|uniref:protein HEATR9-like isoform X2 n=1 Tax=Heptranchias perlo TaxID=212740 RepID=UPI003559619E
MSQEEELVPEQEAEPEYQMTSLFGQRKEARFSKEVLPPLPTRWSGENPESIKQLPHIINQNCVTCQTKTSLLHQAEEQKRKKLKHEQLMRQFHVTSYAVLLSVHKLHNRPRTVDPKQQPFKWQRLKQLLKSLKSAVVLERTDAAKALQCLRCTNTEVVSALYTTLQTDEDCVVKYEAAKALVTLGFWEEEEVLKLIQILKVSTGQILEDIVTTMRRSLRDRAMNPNQQRPEIKAKEKLVFVLTSFMITLRSKDMVPVQAAACLCYINSKDQDAISYIMSYLHDGDSYQKKQHRLNALDLLVAVGSEHIKMVGMHETVFEALKEKLWDDPVLAVRRRVALAVNLLDMKRTMWVDVEQQLAEHNAELRSRAVISLSVLGLPNNRVLQTLLEMSEVDSSQYVRFQIIRTFAKLHLNDVGVKRSLLNRQLGEGPLSREAYKAMKSLEYKSGDSEATLPSLKIN